MYIHEQTDWPAFTWDQVTVSGLLSEVRYLQGRLLGRMESLGFPLREEATLRTLSQDVLKTSEIEGEKLDAAQVRSSLAKRMGLESAALPRIDRNVEGVVDVMLDATRGYAKPLTAERLFGWHAALFPTGRTGLRRLTVGAWRTEASGPMQVVSGPVGRERIHYEAPAHDRLNAEMDRFLGWFNGPISMDIVMASALAHFWFVTIHPFDDGNGRIARAIADLLLARAEASGQRFYSMSAQIQHERKAYYDVLERCQRGDLNLTPWMTWYLACLKRAVAHSGEMLEDVFAQTAFWQAHAGESFNERQRAILHRLLDGFTGKLTSSKWAQLAKCSQDTALRDIGDLLKRQILSKEAAGGRSTGYRLSGPSQR